MTFPENQFSHHEDTDKYPKLRIILFDIMRTCE